MPDQPKPVADITHKLHNQATTVTLSVFSSRDYTPLYQQVEAISSSTLDHAFVSWGIWDQWKLYVPMNTYGLYNVRNSAAAIGQH